MRPTFRSSEVDRVILCNGSIVLVPLVAPRASDEGYEGTLLHWMIASRAIKELGAVPPDGGLPPPDVPKDYRLPAFSLWIVDWAIRHIQETIPADWSLMVEVPLAYAFSRFDLSGHIDLLGISPCGRKSKGTDWKTGRDPVDPADNNEQVASYIALQKRAWETLKECSFDIAQPRADEESGFERVSTVTATKLDAIVDGMDRRICAAMDNTAELNSGRKQCNWCPVGCQCPALQAKKKLMKMKLTPEAIALVNKLPDDALLGDWVIDMRTLARPTKDAEEMLHARLDAVGQVNAGCGLRITRKIQRGDYTVEDPVKFMQAVKMLLPGDASIAKTYTPSMTKIKDEIAEVQHIPKTGKSPITSETVFDAHLRPLVTQGERRILVFT